MKTRDLAERLGAHTSFDRLVRSRFGQELLASARAEQDEIEDRIASTRISTPHVDALRKRVAQQARQDLVQDDTPVVSRFDAADVARRLSRQRADDQGIRRAALHLDRLWRQDEQGVLTIADLAKLRDLFGREFPKSAVVQLFNEDIVRRGFHTLDLRRLARVAADITTQREYDDACRALGIDGTDLAATRARTYIRAVIARRLEGQPRPFVAGDAPDAGESNFHPDVEEQHDDALKVQDGDVKGGPKNAQATCGYCKQQPPTQMLDDTTGGMQMPLCDACAERLVKEYGGGVPEDEQEIRTRLQPLQQPTAQMQPSPMTAQPTGPGQTECAQCGAALAAGGGSFAPDQGGQICGNCSPQQSAIIAQQMPSKEMPAVAPTTPSEPEFTPAVNEQQDDQVQLSPSDAQVKAEAARRRSQAQVETDDPQDVALGENVEQLVNQHQQQNAPAERKESAMQVNRQAVEDILLAGRAVNARGYGIRIASRSGRQQIEVLGHDIPPMAWPLKKIVAAIEFFAQSVEASEINEQQPDAVSVPADLGEDSSSKDIENLEPSSVNEQTPGQEQSGTSKSDFEGLATVNEQEGFPNPAVIQQGWSPAGTSTSVEGAGDQILGPHSSDEEYQQFAPTIEPASKQGSVDVEIPSGQYYERPGRDAIHQAMGGGFGDAGRDGLRRGFGR